MKQNKMVAMILAGGRGSRLYNLTNDIAKPAVHFGGKYRIIDFALSNCANSGIDTVGVAVQYESIVLSSYVSRSQTWGLDIKGGGVYALSPREKADPNFNLYKGTADAITQNLDFLDKTGCEYLLVLSGDHIYKMNYEKMLQKHIDSKADATIAVFEVPMDEASRFGIMNTGKDDVIVEFEEKPAKPKSNLASMGIYIFSYKTLRKYLKADEKLDSTHDFGKDIIPTYLKDGLKLQAYRFEGYWKDVGTVSSLWEANMDLLTENNKLNLFDNSWKIYTADQKHTPSFVGPNAKIDGAYVNQGTSIDGEVSKSVVFTGVEVEEKAKVIDTVLMNDVKVGAGAKLERCIVCEGVKIPANAKFGSKGSKDILLVTKEMASGKAGK